MREEIRSKLDGHIEYLLGKPALTTDEYMILREKYSELPKEKGMDFTLPLLLLAFGAFGGDKNVV